VLDACRGKRTTSRSAARRSRAVSPQATGGSGGRPSRARRCSAADPPGILGVSGAARWKQRALYDVIKDAFALSGTSVRLVRLATYDHVDGVEVGAALRGHAALDLRALAALVKRRST
jgi:hypothetical protein